MPKEGILKFAQSLVKNVRDEAIQSCDININKETTNLRSKRWKVSKSNEELAKIMIMDVVDVTIFCLLRAVDNDELHLSFTR